MTVQERLCSITQFDVIIGTHAIIFTKKQDLKTHSSNVVLAISSLQPANEQKHRQTERQSGKQAAFPGIRRPSILTDRTFPEFPRSVYLTKNDQKSSTQPNTDR